MYHADDKQKALNAVRQDGCNLQYASDKLKNDKDVVFTSFQQLRYLLSTRKLEDYKDVKDMFLEGVKKDGSALQYANNELKNDKVFVLDAFKQNGIALRYASNELKNDKDVVFTSFQQLKYLSPTRKLEDYKDVKDMFLEAMKKNERNALFYASNELKGDKVFVLAAVKQNGNALAYASDNLKNDKEVVLVAVKQNGNALAYASNELKGDVNILQAMNLDKGDVQSMKETMIGTAQHAQKLKDQLTKANSQKDEQISELKAQLNSKLNEANSQREKEISELKDKLFIKAKASSIIKTLLVAGISFAAGAKFSTDKIPLADKISLVLSNGYFANADEDVTEYIINAYKEDDILYRTYYNEHVGQDDGVKSLEEEFLTG